jgi:hypothetical protein
MNPSRSMSQLPHEKKPAPGHKQRPPSSTRCQVSRVARRQEAYLAQTLIHKTEATGRDGHQNAVTTWTEVKTTYNASNLKFCT